MTGRTRVHLHRDGRAAHGLRPMDPAIHASPPATDSACGMIGVSTALDLALVTCVRCQTIAGHVTKKRTHR